MEIELACTYHCNVTFDCHDGYLHDMDYDYIDPEDVTNPCPKCNREEFFLNEARIMTGSVYDRGEWPWRNLVEWYARTFNVSLPELYTLFHNNEELRVIKIVEGEDDPTTWRSIEHDYSNPQIPFTWINSEYGKLKYVKKK